MEIRNAQRSVRLFARRCDRHSNKPKVQRVCTFVDNKRPIRVVAISGSIRRASSNSALFNPDIGNLHTRLRWARRSGLLSACAASQDTVDVLHQRIDRGTAPRRIGERPAIGAEASARVSFGPFL
jgi:hypothetical protein